MLASCWLDCMGGALSVNNILSLGKSERGSARLTQAESYRDVGAPSPHANESCQGSLRSAAGFHGRLQHRCLRPL